MKRSGHSPTYHDLRDRARELLAEPLPDPGGADPDRLLQGLLAALERAARVNEPVGMAEFAVLRARELERLRAFDPYAALARDRQAALRLAELQPAADRTLCWLLFAWEGFIQQQASEALALLETAVSRGVRLSGRHADHATQMLLHLVKHGALGIDAAIRLLDGPRRGEMVRGLLAVGQRAQAEKLADTIPEPELRQQAREDCMRAHLDAMEKSGPRRGETTIDVARAYPRLMAGTLSRLRRGPEHATLARVLGTVARRLPAGPAAQACAGAAWSLAARQEDAEAAATVRHLVGEGVLQWPEDLPTRLRMEALAAAHRWEEALEMAEDAASMGALLYRAGRVDEARGQWQRAEVNQALLTAMLAAGATEEAAAEAGRSGEMHWLAQAAGEARRVDWFQHALAAPDADLIVAGCRASFPLALGAVAELPDPFDKARALYGIATAQAAQGDVEEARATIGLALRAAPRATLALGARAALLEVSPVLTRTVLDQVYQLPPGDERDDALAELAVVQAGEGRSDDLHTTVAYIADPTYPRLHPVWRRLVDRVDWNACRTLLVPFASTLCGAWEVLGDVVAANPKEASAIAARVPGLLVWGPDGHGPDVQGRA
ncbi:MAG: hypothetical protein ACYCW6_03685 [Candidatus Xenobia bacterium]